MRNAFLENSCTKSGRKSRPRPFYKFVISGSTFWNVVKLFFIVCPSQGLPKYVKTKVLATCFYLIQSFLKNKKNSGTGIPTSFSAWFLKKNIYHALYINWTSFIAWLLLLLEIFGNTCIICCFHRTKNVNTSKMKIAFNMKKNIFHHF